MIPEADRVHEMATFYSTTPMYTTSAQYSTTGDTITWLGSVYRVLSVQRWIEAGYYAAVAARMEGA
jgi:hypothetical protein